MKVDFYGFMPGLGDGNVLWTPKHPRVRDFPRSA